jgi:anti-anti-sigma regulatory factor
MSTRYAVPAEFDIYRAAQVGAEIKSALLGLDAGDCLDIDLAAVTEIDAAGLQVLVSAALSGASGAGRIEFTQVPAMLRDRFTCLGIAHLLPTNPPAPAAA